MRSQLPPGMKIGTAGGPEDRPLTKLEIHRQGHRHESKKIEAFDRRVKELLAEKAMAQVRMDEHANAIREIELCQP